MRVRGLPGGSGRNNGRRHSAGQALVEFALVSIVLALLFGTVVDFGRLFYAKITIENAARAGALIAAQAPSAFTGTDCTTANQNTDLIGCAVQNESRGSPITINASQITVTCEDLSGNTLASCPSSPTANQRARVTVSTTLPLLTPMLQVLFGQSSLPLSASAATDQQALPTPNASYVPPTPSPTATATPTPTATPSATPTPSPSASASTNPCPSGSAPVPDLVTGANGPGSTETVDQARTEWQTAGFSPNQFNPSSGLGSKTVTGQYADAGKTQPLPANTCASTTISVYVSYSN